jgi:hypothetical protein
VQQHDIERQRSEPWAERLQQRHWVDQHVGGGCSGAYRLQCFQVGSGPALPAYALPGKRVFVTSANGTGDLGSWPSAGTATGINAGDATCRSLAANAGLPNASNFKAWLSTNAINAGRIASDGRGWWMAFRRQPEDLTDGTRLRSMSPSIGVIREEQAWTGSLSTAPTAGTCGDWTQATRVGHRCRRNDGENGRTGIIIRVTARRIFTVSRRSRFRAWVRWGWLRWLGQAVHAQDYPNRPIRMVVPLRPAG